MQRLCSYLTMVLAAVFPANALADSVEFHLLTHADNVHLLPQPKAIEGVSGDHLLRTPDDISGATFDPNGCFSFNFMNQVGVMPPDYPRGYADGIHSMLGSVTLDVDLRAGGGLTVVSLAFDGYVAPSKPVAQQALVRPGDPAADGLHGPVDGQPNGGTYAASPGANWALAASFDWYYDTPFAGPGGIDMTFDDYSWSGFILPVAELTALGMARTALDDPLDYFGGTSDDFESWLLSEVAPRLGPDAAWLLFAQGEANPVWTDPMMGMTTDGVVGTTIIACAVPEPASALLLACGLCGLAVRRRT